MPTTVHIKFLDKQKIGDFLTSYSTITSPQTSTVKQKEYTATQGVILNKTFVFRLKHPNQKKKRNEKKKTNSINAFLFTGTRRIARTFVWLVLKI